MTTTNDDHNMNLVAEMPESDEAYRATHRVVAFPSRGRVSVREAVSAQNIVAPTPKPRPRSLSTGRTRTHPQDLIQDIYDRMGLQVKRDDPSGTVACNNSVYVTKGSPASNGTDEYGVYSDRSPAPEPVRGRGGRAPTEELSQNDPRRSRSLSRGRSLAKTWPPPAAQEEVLVSPAGTPVRSSKQTPTRTTNGRNATSNVSTFALERAPSYRTSAREWNDEKKEADEPSNDDDLLDEVLKVTPPSVKDRASVFGGANKPKPKRTRNIVRSSHGAQYAAQFAVREKPPKVNIYGSDLRVTQGAELEMEEQREDEMGRRSTGRPVYSAAAAAVALVGEPDCGEEQPLKPNGNKKHSEANSVTLSRSPKSTGKVASNFLSALQKPKPPQEQIPGMKHLPSVPMMEISASGDPAAGNDSASVGMASVSEGEFSPAVNRFGGIGARKQSWQERNRVPAYGAGMNNNIGKKSNASEDIEKIIDERMQAQFQSMESRMEASLHRWMQMMDEKMTARLDVMEEKINGIYHSLETM
jgi:hypothetical protein